MSKKEQLLVGSCTTLRHMPEQIRIVKVESDGEDGLVVTFSDGTTSGYVVEELLNMRPHREPVHTAAAAVEDA